MLRCHVFEPEYRITKSSWLDIKPNVLCVSPVEIFASKIVALLNRTAPRDLYDISNMLKFKLFDEKEKEQLRKCSVLYSAISSDNVPESFQFEAVSNMTVRQIRTDLYPVLRNSERFNLKQCQDEVINELSEILIPSMNDKEFWNGFRNGAYFPELIFGASKESKQIKEHPMALWKCSRNN
jgi:predicted nucleotidyltransferase component of viral defense system